MRKVMRRAWAIARNSVRVFGGAAKDYFAEALKMAWFEEKNQVMYVQNFLENAIETAKAFGVKLTTGYSLKASSKGLFEVPTIEVKWIAKSQLNNGFIPTWLFKKTFA